MLKFDIRSFASRAYRALAQDDKPRGALRRKRGTSSWNFLTARHSILHRSVVSSFLLFPGASEPVILSAEGAKDLLLVTGSSQPARPPVGRPAIRSRRCCPRADRTPSGPERAASPGR